MAAKAAAKVEHGAITGAAAPPAAKPGDGTAAILDKFAGESFAAVTRAASVVSVPAPVIERGRKMEPPRILLYGIEGIGKSTWASKASKPIFVQTEDGLGQIDCERFGLCRQFGDVAQQLTWLAEAEHAYESVVVDSLDWLERLVWDSVCRRTNVANIEKAAGGFAKGYVLALEEWREVVGLLDRCRARGMCVILLAHSKIERFEDPESPAYDRYSPRLHKHAQALLTEWVDAVLFATRRMVVKREGVGFEERAIAAPVGAAGGERIIRTEGSPSCVAKNRYTLPPELPLSWAAVVEHISGHMNGNTKGA